MALGGETLVGDDEVAERPLTAKGRQTRQRIVDAASDLMVEQGVAAVSLDDVGRATSTSKSQLYHYFANKDELVEAVVRCVRDRILDFQSGLLVDATSVEDLRRWADAVVDYQGSTGTWGGCPLGTLASELMAEGGDGRRDLSEAFDAWQLLMESTLLRLQSTGRLAADADPAALAMATLASLQGGLLLAKVAQEARPLEVALDAALERLATFVP